MSKKPKFIQSQEEKDYKAQLHSFMASINPKPDAETVQKQREAYLESRKK